MTSDILMDELLDGWLSAPTMADFLVKNMSKTSQKSPDLSKGSSSLKRDSPPGTSDEDPQTSGQCGNTATRKRRPHTKSRLGCINCKKKKIKCQETWPACENCKKRGSPCRYPAAFKPLHEEHIVSKVASGSLHTLRLSQIPNTFSANDMRLFHHFLTAAYPSIPHDYEYIWTKDVAMFSHQYPYLMHALLGQSASHLALYLDDMNVNVPLVHRQKAIVGLEDAFTRWPTDAEEAHVMLATSYLLAFQSSYMPDAFLDHVLSLRGCSSISQMILQYKFEGAFSVGDMSSEVLERKFQNFPHLNQGLARESLRSVAGLVPLLRAAPVGGIERSLVAQMAETIRQLLVPELGSETTNTPTPDSAGSKSEQPVASEAGTWPIRLPSQYIRSPLIPAALPVSFEEMPWQTIATVPPPSAPCPRRSFDAIMSSLHVLFMCPSDTLIQLFSPSNKLGLVILSHFIALRCIISPLSAPETVMRTPVRSMIEWFDKMIDAVEDDHEETWTQYVEWPRKIQKCLRHCLDKKKGLNFGDLFKLVTEDPGAFKDGRKSDTRFDVVKVPVPETVFLKI